ncbi:hypothetical protein E3U43_017658, partial [Larimichthys crocea]
MGTDHGRECRHLNAIRGKMIQFVTTLFDTVRELDFAERNGCSSLLDGWLQTTRCVQFMKLYKLLS